MTCWKDNLDFTTLVGRDDLVDPSECYLGTLVGPRIMDDT